MFLCRYEGYTCNYRNWNLEGNCRKGSHLSAEPPIRRTFWSPPPPNDPNYWTSIRTVSRMRKALPTSRICNPIETTTSAYDSPKYNRRSLATVARRRSLGDGKTLIFIIFLYPGPHLRHIPSHPRIPGRAQISATPHSPFFTARIPSPSIRYVLHRCRVIFVIFYGRRCIPVSPRLRSRDKGAALWLSFYWGRVWHTSEIRGMGIQYLADSFQQWNLRKHYFIRTGIFDRTRHSRRAQQSRVIVVVEMRKYNFAVTPKNRRFAKEHGEKGTRACIQFLQIASIRPMKIFSLRANSAEMG